MLDLQMMLCIGTPGQVAGSLQILRGFTKPMYLCFEIVKLAVQTESTRPNPLMYSIKCIQ